MTRTSKKKYSSNENTELIGLKLEYIQKDIDEIQVKLDNDYVTQDQFDPVKKIVYGLVGVILMAVAGAVVTLVIK